MTKFKIINTDWVDNVNIDFKNMSLTRESINTEKANIQIKNNILIVKWHHWETEYYAEYNHSFYHLKPIHFKTINLILSHKSIEGSIKFILHLIWNLTKCDHGRLVI